MSNRGLITRVEDISLLRPSTVLRNTRIQGDYSGTSGSHNIAGSGNITTSGNVTNHGHITNHGNTTTNNYYGGGTLRSTDAEILQCLYTSSYQSHLGRVREPAKGTCTWITEHPKYTAWLGNKTSGLLWLSADPGCGKSVIAAFLASHPKLRADAIVCYFFFKDDSEEQRSATFALCAILHQLFEQRSSLCRYAEVAYTAKGRRFTEEVDTLWDILVKAVADGECGEVICVLDALDECDERSLAQLIRRLNRLPGSQTPDIPLKFLVTGRPYHRIETELGSPATTIRLRGEDEVEAISADVARVIDEGIRDLESYWQQPGGLGYLRTLLESSADRTFLWVSLILDVLKHSVDDSREVFANLVSTAPRDLPELYTNILNKSADPAQARRILHIVVAATRPLTLRELNIAFRIRRDHTAIRDIGDLSPGSETTVKNLCGLFVRVIDSKVYLVHQTAREFLIKGTLLGLGEWQYTLSSVDSNFVLADICITYLALEDLETKPSGMGTGGGSAVLNIDKDVQDYALLDYAARYWADHFRDSQDRQMELFESTRRICKRGSDGFLRWLKVYWINNGTYHPFPNDFTHLMIASWLGHRTVVKQLLKDGRDINSRSEKYGTALNVAALRGEEAITRLLVKRGVNAYLRGKNYSILLTRRSELERMKALAREEYDYDAAARNYGEAARAYEQRYGVEYDRRVAREAEDVSRRRESEMIEFLLPFCIDGIRDLATLPRRLIYTWR